MTAVSDALTGEVRTETVEEVAARTRAAAGDDALLETEGLELARALGLGVPRWRVVDGPEAVLDPERTPGLEAAFAEWGGGRVVVKAISRELPHKSELGAVRMVAADRRAVAEELRAMGERLAGVPVDGFGLFELVPHEPGIAGESCSACAGPRLRPGGHHRPGRHRDRAAGDEPGAGAGQRDPVAALFEEGDPEAVVRSRPRPPARGPGGDRAVPWPPAGGAPGRSRPGGGPLSRRRAAAAGERSRRARAQPGGADGERPGGAGRGGAVCRALSSGSIGRASSATTAEEAEEPRRHQKIARLLAPRSVAVMGVSEKSLNPRGGSSCATCCGSASRRSISPSSKKGRGAIDGCRRLPDLSALPVPVDLLVLAVAGDQVPALVEEVAERTVCGEPGGHPRRPERPRAAASAPRRSGGPWRPPDRPPGPAR